MTSVACTTLYQYSRLPSEGSIRVLELFPGHENDRIDCTLHQVKLEDAPKYEAISYAWGDPTNKINVLCDGKVIKVTPNLRDVLHRLRLVERSRTLWADAICINQSDDVEKGSQVKLMASIYGNAIKVCVWLGPTTAQMQPAFELMDAMVTGRTATTDGAEMPPHTAECLTALDIFFSAAWFSRLWVVQEVYGHACVVFCGEHEIPWKDLILIARLLLEFPTTHMANVVSVLQIDSAGLRLSTSGIFDMFRHFDCSDPRDKVYALLSFPPLCDLQPLIQPDYSKSVVEVFEEATIRVFRSCQNLGLLSSIEHDFVMDEEWPSWIPNWQRQRRTQILHDYASGRAQSSVPRMKHSPKTLTLEGMRISTISWCGVVIGGELDKSASAKSEMDPLKQPFRELLSKYLPKITDPADPFLLGIAMTLTVGLDFESNCPPRDLPQFRLDFLAYLAGTLPSLDIFGTLQEASRILTTQAEAGNASNFHTAAIRGCRNKRFFCTPDGAFGIGPKAAQIGDHIVLLYGSNAPSVLRSRGSRYRFVGECYLHQHMHGEAIDMVGEKLLAVEEFEIR